MNVSSNIRKGDLCMYYNIPVIVLEIIHKYNSFIQEESTSYLCLFHNGVDTVPETALRKI